MPGEITLLGSGELMAAMSKVHRAALARLEAEPRPVFLDVTAGFETNVDAIAEKAVDYYRHHLRLGLRVARYHHRERDPPSAVARAVNEIRQSNLIFAGPGSATYTVKHLRDTPVWEAVLQRFHDGAHLLFASAASVAIGRYAIPVYEIYKVGEDPFWAEGLDLFGALGLNLAAVPHFDDRSGGASHDTRYCFIGEARFEALKELLPSGVTILGIDGYTAVTFDPRKRVARVSGQGGMTSPAEGETRRWPSGAEVPFEEIQAGAAFAVGAGRNAKPEAVAGPAHQVQPSTFQALAALIEEMQSLGTGEKVAVLGLLEAAREEVERLSGSDSALMDLLVELRQHFRKQRRFDIADMARDRLSVLGYEIHDTPEGSTWERQG
jgi:hypothetical protein